MAPGDLRLPWPVRRQQGRYRRIAPVRGTGGAGYAKTTGFVGNGDVVEKSTERGRLTVAQQQAHFDGTRAFQRVERGREQIGAGISIERPGQLCDHSVGGEACQPKALVGLHDCGCAPGR